MFDPTIGRWLMQDPEGFNANDPNLYRYVKNDPVNATDPSGLDEITEADIKANGFPECLTNPTFDFKGGKGKVEVFTGVEFTSGLTDLIRIKFTTNEDIKDTHWVQIFQSRQFPRGKEDVQAQMVSVVKGDGKKVKLWTIDHKNKEWGLDVGKDSTPYYDATGITFRGKNSDGQNELSIFDRPSGPLGTIATPGGYTLFEFKDYLVSAGKVYYEVKWSLKVGTIKKGAVLERYFDYYDVSGKPTTVKDLPEILTKDEIPIGNSGSYLSGDNDVMIVKPPKLITVPNPIKIKP